MHSKNSDSINLIDLAKGFPAITPVFGATLAEACVVCLSDLGHQGLSSSTLIAISAIKSCVTA